MSVIKNNKIKFEEGIRSAEDVEFNRQYLKITKTIKFIDEYFYIYNCTNASSITKKKVQCLRIIWCNGGIGKQQSIMSCWKTVRL